MGRAKRYLLIVIIGSAFSGTACGSSEDSSDGYTTEKAVEDAVADAGEKEEFDAVCRACGIDLISLIAPPSNERISMIAREARGFVYCVSSLGVTGERRQITTDIGKMTALVKAQQDIPCAVGFGISTPEQAAEMARCCDGVIVGSAIVRLCGKYGKECIPYVAAYVRQMKAALEQTAK